MSNKAICKACGREFWLDEEFEMATALSDDEQIHYAASADRFCLGCWFGAGGCEFADDGLE